MLEEGYTVVSDEIGEVIFIVVVSVFYDFAVKVETVVVEASVADKCHPLVPAGRNVVAVVLVQVLAKVPRPVPSSGEVRSEGTVLVLRPPVPRAAVLVVSVDVVVVNVETSKQGTATRATHWRRHESVGERCALVCEKASRFRHVIHRT